MRRSRPAAQPPRQEFPALAQAFRVDAVADSGRDMPFASAPRAPPGPARRGTAPAPGSGRPARHAPAAPAAGSRSRRRMIGVDILRHHQHAGIADDGAATGRRRPTCSAIMVPCEKPTSASAEGGSWWRASSASRKCVQRRRRHLHAGPALVRIAEGERKPFAPDRRLAAGAAAHAARRRRRPAAGRPRRGRSRSGRCRRRRSRAGRRQVAWPRRSVAPGAGRRVQPFRGFPFRRFLLGLRCLLARLLGRLLGRAVRLNRDHVALLHHVIIGPQQMRRHAAPGPPGFAPFW